MRVDLEYVKTEMRDACRELSDAGLTPGTSGNISRRIDDERVLITPSGRNYASIDVNDFVEVSINDAKPLAAGGLRPSTETLMHVSVLGRRGDLEWLLHTHSSYATSVSMWEIPIPPFHYMLLDCSRTGSVPVVEYRTPGSGELAKRVADVFSDGVFACLLGRHGALCGGGSWGSTLARARLLEWACQVFLLSRQGGELRYLDNGELERVRKVLEGYGK